jgi:hypothetical protein
VRVRAGAAPHGAFASTGAEWLCDKAGTARVPSVDHSFCTSFAPSFQLLLLIEGSPLYKNSGITDSRHFQFNLFER